MQKRLRKRPKLAMKNRTVLSKNPRVKYAARKNQLEKVKYNTKLELADVILAIITVKKEKLKRWKQSHIEV